MYTKILVFLFSKHWSHFLPPKLRKIPLTASSSLQTFNPCHQMLIQSIPNPAAALCTMASHCWRPSPSAAFFPSTCPVSACLLPHPEPSEVPQAHGLFLACVCSSQIPLRMVWSDLSVITQRCGVWEASPTFVLFFTIHLIVLRHLLSHVWFSTTLRDSTVSHCSLT